MFIPYELEIDGRPELRKFPANVLFAKVATKGGVSIGVVAPWPRVKASANPPSTISGRPTT